MLSVFVNLDPTELPTPPARATAISSILTEAAHRVEKVEAPHAEREELKHDLHQVEEVLRDGSLASDGTHGVALYVCRAADLLELIRLPHPVRSQVVVDRAPFVEPLVREADEELWSVLLANRRVARIFAGVPERLEETDRIVDNVRQQHDQGGWSQANYQRSVEKDKDDHVIHTVEVLFEAHKAHPIDRLLLGSPPELLSTYEHRLHPYLRERLVGRLHLDVEQANLEEVRRQTVEAATEWTRRCEREELDRLAEGVGRGERGAAGLAAVLDALNTARVELLLVQPGLREPGFRDPEHRPAVRHRGRRARRARARAGRGRRRGGTGQGDRAGGRRARRAPPRRPRPAWRHRGRSAILSRCARPGSGWPRSCGARSPTSGCSRR